GLKAFHCRGMGVQLIPDFPMSSAPIPVDTTSDPATVATITLDGHTHVYDYTAMLACALGKPSDAMGPHYKVFDGTRRMPRLPREPFHSPTRATNLDGTPNVERIGTSVTLEYDVPADAWYFNQKTIQTMPFSIL